MGLKRIIGSIIRVAKPIARPVIDLVAPVKVKQVLKIAGAVKRIIKKPKGDAIVNAFETAVRNLVVRMLTFDQLNNLERIFALVPTMLEIQELASVIGTKPKTEWVPLLREALDNLVGSEEDALIGDHPNARIKVDLRVVSIEDLSDFLFSTIEKNLLSRGAESTPSTD